MIVWRNTYSHKKLRDLEYASKHRWRISRKIIRTYIFSAILTKCCNYATIYYVIYNRIHLLRAEAGLTRQALADKLDINYQTIGFIERGDYMPSLELAFKIANVFDVEISVIFSDKPFESIFMKKGTK